MRQENSTIFTPPHPLNTAVLFLVFNRLDTTMQVFEAIRQAKPPRLYVASDGAREAKEGEADKVNAVRDYIMSNIDWECEVKTLFREHNLGCKYAVSGAIDWFFDNEEMGIILEDDCLPSQSFFWFCERMLHEYIHDSRVMMISGTNMMLDIRNEIKKDYFFSRYFTIWGWATWRSAWKLYDVEIPTWRNEIQPSDITFVSNEKYIIKYFENSFDLILHNKINTWDIQWVYICLFNYGLCLTPCINMISNVGVDGTHTTGTVTDSHFLKTYDFENIDKVTINKLVYPEQFYDIWLHQEKSLKTYRKELFMKLLKNLGLYNLLRKLYRLFK